MSPRDSDFDLFPAWICTDRQLYAAKTCVYGRRFEGGTLNTAEIERRASFLVNTSVDDTRSSITSYQPEDLPVLHKALEISEGRKEKTRTKLLRAKIHQLTKSK
jgi:hypothetical protein